MTTLPPVLIVDHDRSTRRMFAEVFTLEGYTTVAEAANGQKALDFLASHPGRYLITLGLMMPVMDGWQFMHALEARPDERRKHRIIVVSGSVRGLATRPLDVEAVLAKPFTYQALMDAVEPIVQHWDDAPDAHC